MRLFFLFLYIITVFDVSLACFALPRLLLLVSHVGIFIEMCHFLPLETMVRCRVSFPKTVPLINCSNFSWKNIWISFGFRIGNWNFSGPMCNEFVVVVSIKTWLLH